MDFDPVVCKTVEEVNDVWEPLRWDDQFEKLYVWYLFIGFYSLSMLVSVVAVEEIDECKSCINASKAINQVNEFVYLAVEVDGDNSGHLNSQLVVDCSLQKFVRGGKCH